ncbi:hypothetical protein LOD99_14289 [Oopsacas minuta]|uniref:Uncharacterized protein n=1 Tax=Oopsacas minuta TaxID=111878 RepID=A0AAV7KHA0_9METZ|nr:hypothetical protein LOD99_14289 [Oopsacas minuta]
MAEANDDHEKDLKFKRENKDWKFYGVDNIGQEDNPTPSTNTLFWYRAIEQSTYTEMVQSNQFPNEAAYGGIANNHKYVGKYLTNKSEANRIIEFNTVKLGLLSEYFTKNGINAPKPEDGAISYGLGLKGNKPVGKPLILFNDSMRKGDITWRVVDKKVPK